MGAITPDDKIAVLIQFGRKCKVEPKMSLISGATTPMCDELAKFFYGIIGHMTIMTLKQTGTITGAQVAKALDVLGVQSASGRIVSPGHVSNCIKALLKAGPAYSKDRYKGFNHRSFNSKRQPPKDRFSS